MRGWGVCHDRIALSKTSGPARVGALAGPVASAGRQRAGCLLGPAPFSASPPHVPTAAPHAARQPPGCRRAPSGCSRAPAGALGARRFRTACGLLAARRPVGRLARRPGGRHSRVCLPRLIGVGLVVLAARGWARCSPALRADAPFRPGALIFKTAARRRSRQFALLPRGGAAPEAPTCRVFSPRRQGAERGAGLSNKGPATPAPLLSQRSNMHRTPPFAPGAPLLMLKQTE